MAGHSQYKNIMYRKGAQDAKRAKKFAKITREIIIAIKSGLADSEVNPRLRAALALARAANMPKDNIERAIKRATGEGDATSYEEVRYEGYGPGGVAIIIESLTDNRNRTASEVRSTLTKYGGNLGETGSVHFNFERLGLIRFSKTVGSFNKVFEAAVEAGADNVEEMSDFYEVTTTIEQFGHVRDNLIKLLGDFE
ncbi:MAG: YebC/PmpR family DNA-binding transcriptional regulator, partial [Proteobacteria bacterium]|nr:YebC/PmpR family DNA-binding transcriptional regulator [Pseudomonadota bacterium]